jgi:hypothetical protein
VSRETPAKTKFGKRAKRPPRRRKKTAPQLPEKTRKLTLKAFRLTYEAHHDKASSEVSSVSTEAAKSKKNGAATQPKSKRVTKQKGKKPSPSADQMMLEMWKKIYRDHHPEAKR